MGWFPEQALRYCTISKCVNGCFWFAPGFAKARRKQSDGRRLGPPFHATPWDDSARENDDPAGHQRRHRGGCLRPIPCVTCLAKPIPHSRGVNVFCKMQNANFCQKRSIIHNRRMPFHCGSAWGYSLAPKTAFQSAFVFGARDYALDSFVVQNHTVLILSNLPLQVCSSPTCGWRDVVVQFGKFFFFLFSRSIRSSRSTLTSSSLP